MVTELRRPPRPRQQSLFQALQNGDCRNAWLETKRW